jgi:hypothetical protein
VPLISACGGSLARRGSFNSSFMTDLRTPDRDDRLDSAWAELLGTNVAVSLITQSI